jgi:hypothetical protein
VLFIVQMQAKIGQQLKLKVIACCASKCLIVLAGPEILKLSDFVDILCLRLCFKYGIPWGTQMAERWGPLLSHLCFYCSNLVGGCHPQLQGHSDMLIHTHWHTLLLSPFSRSSGSPLFIWSFASFGFVVVPVALVALAFPASGCLMTFPSDALFAITHSGSLTLFWSAVYGGLARITHSNASYACYQIWRLITLLRNPVYVGLHWHGGLEHNSEKGGDATSGPCNVS